MPGCFAKRRMPFTDHVGLLHKVEVCRTAQVCRKTDSSVFPRVSKLPRSIRERETLAHTGSTHLHFFKLITA